MRFIMTAYSQRSALALVVALVTFFSASGAMAQVPEVPQPSPKARVDQRVGVTDFSIEYSSPGVKGRKIWDGLLPSDQLWRTGANAATKLTASRDFTFGDKLVPAGSYALYTIPGKNTWTVLLNTNANASGTTGYDAKNDVARITVKPASVGHRERLAFIFSDTAEDGTRLDLEWEKLRVSVPIKVDTKAQVLASIDKTLAEAWRPHFMAARWQLDSGGDLDLALTHIDTSIGIKATWWNNWIRAQILGKKGRTSEAAVAAEKAQQLGKDDNVYGFFKDEIAKAIGEWKKKA